jgi:hypothetical protein
VEDDSRAFIAADINRVGELTPSVVQQPILPGRLMENDEAKTFMMADEESGAPGITSRLSLACPRAAVP